MTWGDQGLHPGDRVVDSRNRRLWWLVYAETDDTYYLVYLSPDHLESGMGGRTGAIFKSREFPPTFVCQHKVRIAA